MDIIISTTSVKDTSSYTNTLHTYHHQIKNLGTALHLHHSGPANNDLLREFAKTISKEGRDRGFARLDVYKKWFEDTFLVANDNSTLIIMPQESMQPRYRDEVPKYVNLKSSVHADSVNSFERPPPGVNCLALAAVLEAPALTIPSTSELVHDFIEC